jgi:hypothetical protein
LRSQLARGLASSLLCLLPAQTQADFFNGTKLLELLSSGETQDTIVANGYIMGSHDTLHGAMDLLPKEYHVTFRSCIPEGVNSGQFRAIVKKYLEDHPDKLHFGASTIVNAAMAEAFPCRK